MSERLPPQPCEWIDRDRPLAFRFEGRRYTGFAGDVLASALWAAGVRFTGRSFKYHRPRGIYSLANHDANFLVESENGANIRGDVCPLVDGLDVRAVNTWGSLANDRLRITEKFGKLMPVGFYYKGFHTPRRLFPFYERQMRKVAGLGRVNPQWSLQTTPKDYAFCDLLVIGAGPAGLSGALAAADSGAQVLVVDESARAGGSLNWQWAANGAGRKLREELVERVADHPNIKLRMATQAAGCYADRWVALVDSERLTKARAKAILVASGCIEQPAVFQNNDLPGVILASAAQRLMHQYAVRPFRQAVVLAGNEEGYRVAAQLHQQGVEVRAVVDLEDQRTGAAVDAVYRLGIRVFAGSGIHEARATKNRQGVAGAVVAPICRPGVLDDARTERIACDGIAVSVGWAPTSDLLFQAGARFAYDDHLHQLVPEQMPAGLFAAGRVRGVYDLADQQIDGKQAAARACAYLGLATDNIEIDSTDSTVAHDDGTQNPLPHHKVVSPCSRAHSHPYPIFPHPGKKNFVDLDEDLHLADFVHAWQEGYDNVELLKRYSTVGMGPSQGKLSNQNAIRILARLNDATIDATGTTTSRPFHQPVRIDALAGRRFHPERRTPLHEWHAEQDAVFTRVGGGWLRPQYYERDGLDRESCILNEARHVRTFVGIMDLGTLGKIHVSGPDALELLNRVYTGSFTKQKTNTIRYALACDEAGVVIDDGVVVRWADDQFYVTATSSGSDAFFRELQRWALVWRLDVTLVNLTGQYAAINVAGPASRDVLARLCDVDLAADAFPFSAARQALVAGHRASVLRVGFVGELAYEIHLYATSAAHVWNELIESGRAADIQPFGVECQRLLRLEKGHLIVGQDTDALTTPLHLGMQRLPGSKKKFFVGKRSLQVLDQRPLDRKLVGIQFEPDYRGPLPEECCLVIAAGNIAGRVTSIAEKTTLDFPIGLAMVTPDLAAPGTNLEIRTSSGVLAPCRVVETPFYDPDNYRQQL